MVDNMISNEESICEGIDIEAVLNQTLDASICSANKMLVNSFADIDNDSNTIYLFRKFVLKVTI